MPNCVAFMLLRSKTNTTVSDQDGLVVLLKKKDGGCIVGHGSQSDMARCGVLITGYCIIFAALLLGRRPNLAATGPQRCAPHIRNSG